ncbi:MAG: CTP synthase, partial [Alphaproteobacteria bacterium]|nr:CTP synthase [Alphaproteobacteria bacterium]
MAKFIFITGGVISSLGKGVASATIAALLKARGFKVRNRKMDPYLNIDPGTLSPYQHGEVFVTDDGAETDLDVGHYERYADNICTHHDSISSGRIYWNVLNRERQGGYGGRNIQLIPEITNEVKDFIKSDIKDEDFIIYEVGGTVGEDEGFIFTEAVRQLISKIGRDNALLIHLTYVPFFKPSGEIKTKPTQQSVRMLQERGLAADIILCRSENKIPLAEKKKISMFCNVDKEDVISAPDVKNIYELPLIYRAEKLDERILAHFGIADPLPSDLSIWEKVVEQCGKLDRKITVGMIAKYASLADAYKSVVEAIDHAGIANGAKVEIDWISSETLEGLSDAEVAGRLKNLDAIIVPGGFGNRGIEGKIAAAKYAREN